MMMMMMMMIWKVELAKGRQTLPEVIIQRGIFHGDSLVSLLFVITL